MITPHDTAAKLAFAPQDLERSLVKTYEIRSFSPHKIRYTEAGSSRQFYLFFDGFKSGPKKAYEDLLKAREAQKEMRRGGSGTVERFQKNRDELIADFEKRSNPSNLVNNPENCERKRVC